ncbi:major allergen Alt a 1 subunit [Dothidotthia symphoricarpi CBS 119687]|uniref:Major allergen Alt a 1 subunit n=1 Tax=Dothidotthia symphoricarpi CBS 119687 TaxID=1392245 RepID=A0A6A6AQ54_9PLEO|nr:major allergen Alt a 1 subunit [Dothidotthia symphoricarpi CBS 119687]KAF2133145.1 major allergen Alt a 1 subunit [Dothidotthia symphoricarpi CBS 119687]
MQFTIVAAFLAAAGITAASPIAARQEPVATPSGDYIWKISEFYSRKLNGKDIDSLAFNIKATNNGTLDFTCEATEGPIVPTQFYQCGENSQIYFSFQDDRSGLLLRQDVSDDIQYVGTATLPNYCRAGGAGINDFICNGVNDAYLTLVQYPGTLE